MRTRLLLDEHYSDAIAGDLRAAGHDVVAVVTDPDLRAQTDAETVRRAAAAGRRIVTENIKDFRRLLQQAYADSDPVAQLLLVPPKSIPPRYGSTNDGHRRRFTRVVGCRRRCRAPGRRLANLAHG